MFVAEVARTLNLIFFLYVIQLCSAQYSIPDVTIQVFDPKGFKVSIPDAPNLSLFVFQGKVNRVIGNNDVGSLSGTGVKGKDGLWSYENVDVQLNIGDVINYYVFVSVNQAGYLRDNLTFTVTKLEDIDIRFGIPTTSKPPNEPVAQCQPTVTRFRGVNSNSPICSGQTIFEDDFNKLQGDVWRVEHHIPITHLDYPFVSYQRQTVSITNSNLRIRATLQENEPGYNHNSIISGKINLISGCTSPQIESCYVQAPWPDIIPPVVTGRVVSQNFAFTYGTVIVRAKLPQGDWLYPVILLEPLLKSYGIENDVSGILKIATARGNKVLRDPLGEYGNKVLYGGPVIDARCHEALLSSKSSTGGKNWGDDFHEYSVRWSPESIILSVDNEEWARVEAVDGGLRSQLPQDCQNAKSLPSRPPGSAIAPFDDFFSLTLGLDAGGITEFKDNIYTEGNRTKPWTNFQRKGRYNFWNGLDAWYPTWTQPELLVDYVKVIAL